MKNIKVLKEKYEKKFARKIKKDFNLSEEEGSLHCSIMSEIWAYFECIIPEDFIKYSLFDLHGITEGENQLDPKIFIKAKNILCKYCWGAEWQKIDEIYKSDEKEIRNFTWHNSVMERRLRKGENVIIFGTSIEPIGKTIFASIIMKEAIKLRRKPGFKGQTYEWVDLAILQRALLNEKESNEIGNYRTCDWLVVDNINRMDFTSVKQREYISSLLNPFFIERCKNKLPTILVLRFDIENCINIEEAVGLGIANIFNSKRTYKIRLSPKLEYNKKNGEQ